MKNIRFYSLLTLMMLMACGARMKAQIQDDGVSSEPVGEYLITKVIINENDCFRCFGGNQILQRLSEVSKVELVFNGLDDNFINRLLEVNKITLKDGMSIVNDTSVYRALNTCNMTEAHVYDNNGEEYMAFPFKFGPSIDDVVSEMRILNEGLYYEQHPVKLNLTYKSGMIKLFVDEDHIVVLNRTTNTCEVFDKKGSRLVQIDATELDPISFFPEMRELESATNYLKSSGVFSCRIEKAICKEEEIVLLVSVPYAKMENNSIIQEVFPCIVSYTHNDEGWTPHVLFSSKEIILADIIAPSNISHPTGVVVPFGKPQIDLQCVGMEIGQDYEFIDYHIHSMKSNDGPLQIVESRQINFPSFDRIKSFNYEPKIKDGLFALGYTDYLYDPNRDTTYTLPMKSELSMEGKSMTNLMVKSNGHVVDWSFDGNDLSVIYFDEVNKECKFIFLKKGAEDFVIVPLSFGGRLKCPYLFMVSPRVFYYLNLENEVCAKVINAELLQMQ